MRGPVGGLLMEALRGLAAAAVLVALFLPMAGALSSVPADLPAVPTAAWPSRAGLGAAPAPVDAAEYAVRFVCPDVADAPGVPLNAGQAACPAYVLDREDIFGQPVMVVDPRNPTYVAFSAMHGGRGVHGPNDEPPSERSRDDVVHQPHTTFISKSGGAGWEDFPYHAPDGLQRTGTAGQRTRQIFGEDNAAVQDATGRLYVAALYAYRDAPGGVASAAGPFSYGVGVWKMKGPEHAPDYLVNTKILDSGNDARNAADSLHLAYVAGSDTVVALWREQAPEELVADPAGASSVVLHWTRPTDGAMWERVEPGIGPCDRISNPVAVASTLYLACGVDDEPVRVYGVDTTSWSATLTGNASVLGDHLLLVPRLDFGYMILVGSGLAEDASPIVDVSYGEMGARWSSPDSVAGDLPAPAFPLLEARVTAAAYAPKSGNLHLIYLLRYDLASANADTGQTPEFAKFFASMVAEGRFLRAVDLGVGTVSRLGFSPTLTGASSGAFNDLHDSLVVWDGGPHGMPDREFLAFGDYGYVRFAEIAEENFAPPIVPLGTQVPPVPFATPGSIPLLVGVGAGAISSAFVARTIAARRAAAVEVGSE